MNKFMDKFEEFAIIYVSGAFLVVFIQFVYKLLTN